MRRYVSGSYPNAEVVAWQRAHAMRPDAYNQLAEAQAERDWAIIDQLREHNRDKDPKQIERDIEEALAEVRLERRRARQQPI